MRNTHSLGDCEGSIHGKRPRPISCAVVVILMGEHAHVMTTDFALAFIHLHLPVMAVAVVLYADDDDGVTVDERVLDVGFELVGHLSLSFSFLIVLIV